VIIVLALALVILQRRRLDMRRKKARGPPPLQRPTTEAHEPPPAVATAAPELNPAAPEGSVATSLEVGELTTLEAPENAPPEPVPVPVPVDVNLEINVNNVNVNVPAEPALEAQSLCSDKDLRAVDVVEWLLYSARAAVFSPFQAAKEPEPAEEAAQAEAARAAAEEAAQAAEAARAQVLDHRSSRVQKLRSRRSTFNFPRHVVPPAAFPNVRDVTRGRDSERARVTWKEWQRSMEV
jgi:hypothetical protein